MRLEATPSYFYGGAALATKMGELLTNPRVLVILREPVSRALSFFAYQKIRLRFPADMSIVDYLAAADALSDDDFGDPENEKYMAFRGGCYADYLPAWLETFGTDRLHVDVVRGARLRSCRRREPTRGVDGARSRRGSPTTRSAPRTAPPASRTRHSRASR